MSEHEEEAFISQASIITDSFCNMVNFMLLGVWSLQRHILCPLRALFVCSRIHLIFI